MWQRIEDILSQQFTKLDNFLGMGQMVLGVVVQYLFVLDILSVENHNETILEPMPK